MLLKNIRESAGITQVGLAHKAGVGKQHIMRIEQGVYSNVPDNIIEAYADLADLSPVQLKKDYSDELYERRYAMCLEIRERVLSNGGWSHAPAGLLNFRLWLGFPSRIGFCKALACHPATVLNYEKGKAKRLPSDLKEALLSVGVPESILRIL